ncbi:MAG: hypothetical protein ACRDUV_17755 [Pseudonocardiaceae bacterium]
MTNVGSVARNFTSELGGKVIYKPMSPGVLAEQGTMRVINATLVTSDFIDDAAVGHTAHTFQQWIDKEFDARVTVVGDRCFGVAIHAANALARTDWRADYDALTYSTVEVPADVQAGVGRYLSRFGLLFAAFDFSVAQDGTWWFLEPIRTGYGPGWRKPPTFLSQRRLLNFWSRRIHDGAGLATLGWRARCHVGSGRRTTRAGVA